MTKKKLCKRDAHLPTAREFAAGLVEILDREAKAGKDLACVALELIAAKALEAVLNAPVFIEELFGYPALLPRLGDGELEFLSTLAEFANLVRGVHHLVDDGYVGCEFGLLFQIADVHLFGEGDRPRIRRIEPHDDFQQGGFARSVGANQGEAIARVDLK